MSALATAALLEAGEEAPPAAEPHAARALAEAVRRRLEDTSAVLVELRDRKGQRAVRWLEGIVGAGVELRATVVEGPDRLLVRPGPSPADLREGDEVGARVFDFVQLTGLFGTPLFRQRGMGPPAVDRAPASSAGGRERVPSARGRRAPKAPARPAEAPSIFAGLAP